MSRARFAMPALAAAALAVAPAQAQAVNSPAYTFVVDCASSAPVSSAALGVTLPAGQYAVTAVGACSLSVNNQTTPVSTCGVLASPCVDTGATVTLPSAACLVTVGAATAGTCGLAVNGSCAPGAIQIDGGPCVATAGVVHHAGGAMTARFVDGPNYADNVGAFVVTAVWTPL